MQGSLSIHPLLFYRGTEGGKEGGRERERGGERGGGTARRAYFHQVDDIVIVIIDPLLFLFMICFSIDV